MFILHAHLVLVTRYPVFAARHPDCTEQIIRDMRAGFGTELAGFNARARARAPAGEPHARGGDLPASSLNGVSSRRLRQEFPDLRQHCWQARRLRSGSHFAGSADRAPTSVLPQYTEQQDPPA